MKKTNYLLVTISIVAMALFSSCEKKCKKCDEEGGGSVNPPKGTVCYKNNGRPGNMLTYKEIVSMLTQYDNTRKPILEKELGKEDTRINTYKISELRDYLAYIEDLCKEKQIKLTGINIISSTYPEKYPTNPEYANKQTLIFMPVTNIDGEDVTFDPLQSSVGKPATFRELLARFNYNWGYDAKKIEITNTQKAGFLSLDVLQDLESSGANRGQLIPPPYNE